MKEGKIDESKVRRPRLFAGRNAKSLLFLILVFGAWNFAASASSSIFPYVLSILGNLMQPEDILLQVCEYAVSFLACTFVFMPFSDRPRARRWLFLSGALLCIAAMALIVVFRLNTGTIILFVLFWGYGCGCGELQFCQIWASELFPTRFRATAQGFIWAAIRIPAALWLLIIFSVFTFLVPTPTSVVFILAALMISFSSALCLTIFCLFSLVIGMIFMPDTAGKSLQEIEIARSDIS